MARFIQRLQFWKKNKSPHALDKKLVMSLKKSRIPTWTQLKKVTALLSPRERKVLGSVFLVLVVSVVTWGYMYQREHVRIVPAYGGVWSEALIGQPAFINPILAQTSDIDLDISRLIYRGLLRYDADLTLVNDLAEEITVDETKTLYTVRLRSDAVWQDGQPITVDDVIFTIRAIQDPAWGSPLLISFKGITIDKLDEQTIAFNLPEPFNPFMSLLSVGLLPKHIWQDIPPTSARLAELNIKPIGSGPWKFGELAKEKSGTLRSYTLAPNDQYTGKKPYLSEMVFKFYPDFITALDALNQNQVMGMSFLPADLQPGVAEPKKYTFHALNLPQYTALFFNQKQNAFLKSRAVRTALARAIDKQRLISEGLLDQAEKITSPLLALENKFDTDLLSYNSQTANSILDENGWKLNEEGFRINADGETLAVRITTVDNPENAVVASIIKEEWEALGVQTTVQLIPATDIQTDIIKNRDYDILLYGAIIGADPDPFPFWHSSQTEHPGLNLSLFKDGNTDELLESARQEQNADKRFESYTAFRNILQEEVPAVFLYTPTYTYVQEKRLKGLNVNQLIIPADRFNNNTEWYTKTKRTLE